MDSLRCARTYKKILEIFPVAPCLKRGKRRKTNNWKQGARALPHSAAQISLGEKKKSADGFVFCRSRSASDLGSVKLCGAKQFALARVFSLNSFIHIQEAINHPGCAQCHIESSSRQRAAHCCKDQYRTFLVGARRSLLRALDNHRTYFALFPACHSGWWFIACTQRAHSALMKRKLGTLAVRSYIRMRSSPREMTEFWYAFMESWPDRVLLLPVHGKNPSCSVGPSISAYESIFSPFVQKPVVWKMITKHEESKCWNNFTFVWKLICSLNYCVKAHNKILSSKNLGRRFFSVLEVFLCYTR